MTCLFTGTARCAYKPLKAIRVQMHWVITGAYVPIRILCIPTKQIFKGLVAPGSKIGRY